VDAAVGQQPHDVERPSGEGGVGGRLAEGGVIKKIAVPYGFRDTRKILVHDAAGADIQVPDLGIPHLPIRQADILAARGDRHCGVFAVDPVEVWLLRRGYGIAVRLAARAEAVKDDEHGRPVFYFSHKICAAALRRFSFHYVNINVNINVNVNANVDVNVNVDAMPMQGRNLSARQCRRAVYAATCDGKRIISSIPTRRKKKSDIRKKL
jgi:hypothetical protein